MQLPSVDRQSGLRPAGADLVSANGPKVNPVPPVNPPLAVNPPAPTAQPGVVNKIGEAASIENTVYNSVPDPIRRGGESAAAPRDWTIKRPEPEKVEEPPPVPLSQILLDFIKSMWQASGMAVELSQVQKQNPQVNAPNPNAVPGDIARESLTYSPTKIKKPENI